MLAKCDECGIAYTMRRKEQAVCSKTCAARRGGRAFHDRYSQVAENNPSWKGGASKDYARYRRQYAARYPEKVRANRAVETALQSGRLTRRPCEACDEQKSQAHHADYSKPLEVTWLCGRCHRLVHGKAS